MHSYSFIRYLSGGFLVSLILYLVLQGPYMTVRSGIQEVSLREAEKAYKAGEKAKTVADRKQAFNHALSLYTQMDKDYNPHFSDGKLYYNIGNSYFQLGEYPLAAYYYYRALALSPRNAETQHNLAETHRQLQIAAPPSPSLFKQIFAFSGILSLPQRLSLFFWLSILLLVIASLYIWKRFTWIKPLIAGVSILLIYLLCGILYTRFLASQEGILVKSTPQYRDAGYQYAKINPEPLSAGLKVEVTGIQENGAWVKILSPNGTLGFVPSEAIRLL